MAPRIIQIDALADQLLLKPHGTDDYGVLVEAGEHGRLTAGRIMRVQRASGRTCWFWTITGPAEPEAGVALVGEADDLDTAAMLFWALMASGQITMRKVDGWQTLTTQPLEQEIDLAA